jgi:hypothetical protein
MFLKKMVLGTGRAIRILIILLTTMQVVMVVKRHVRLPILQLPEIVVQTVQFILQAKHIQPEQHLTLVPFAQTI